MFRVESIERDSTLYFFAYDKIFKLNIIWYNSKLNIN